MNGGRSGDTGQGQFAAHAAPLRTKASRKAVTGRRAGGPGGGFLVVRPLRMHREPNDPKGRDSCLVIGDPHGLHLVTWR